MDGETAAGLDGLSATEKYEAVPVDASEEPCMPEDAWENLDRMDEEANALGAKKEYEEGKTSQVESDAPGALLTRTLLQGGSASHRGLGAVEPAPQPPVGGGWGRNDGPSQPDSGGSGRTIPAERTG